MNFVSVFDSRLGGYLYDSYWIINRKFAVH